MKLQKTLLALLALTLVSCGTASSGDSSSSSSDSPSSDASNSSSESSDTSDTSSSSEYDGPEELADIHSLGLLLYEQISNPSNGHYYNNNGDARTWSYTTREILGKTSDTSFSYQGLIGGYYRNVYTGDSSVCTPVDETYSGGDTAYWESWMNSAISWNSLSNHFNINSAARPFGIYDEEAKTLSGTSTTTVYRVAERSNGYRVYFESYLETSNTEISIYQNYEITGNVYLDSDLTVTEIDIFFERASDSNWDSSTHSIIDSSSALSSTYEISGISWGDIPAYDDENPLIDFEPYFMTSLTDIDITDTETGWTGSDGNPKVGDGYEVPHSATKMTFEPSTALNQSEVEITNVSPSDALDIKSSTYGVFLLAGEVEITFGTESNPNMLTKTYTVSDGDITLSRPTISYFEGDLEQGESSLIYNSTIALGATATFTGITGLSSSVYLDMSKVTETYDDTFIRVSRSVSHNNDGKIIVYSVTALASGSGTLSISVPATSTSAFNKNFTINITVS